ncbi:hypothetical protein DL767_008739 [Monosporascus sp. MG133]|nr:hypothetical protein DL767_008739 [Monosporascus sp. MG133]
MSHSKRNTSRAVFTSHERDLARRAWGATSARLSRESFLPFASCALCLEVARDPVACATRGDLFCRECALSNILAQKREAKRLERARELGAREARDARARADEEARERAVREFEMVQNGLDVGGRAKAGKPDDDDDDDDRTPRNNGNGGDKGDDGRPGKRKLALDADELARAVAEEDRRKARRLLDAERAEAAAKAALPSFWTPSMTPSTASNTNTDEKKNKKTTKTTPICPASREDDAHPYSLHTLVTVNFTEEEEEEEGGGGGGGRRTRRRVCPACRKGLSNASKAVLAKPCGHVLCRGCVDKFMRPGGTGGRHHNHHADPHAPEDGLRCYVCEADLTDKPSSTKENGGNEGNGDDANNDGDNDGKAEKDGGKKKKKEKDKERERMRPGLVELRSEGTGFSAAGANEVKKVGVAFQC